MVKTNTTKRVKDYQSSNSGSVRQEFLNAFRIAFQKKFGSTSELYDNVLEIVPNTARSEFIGLFRESHNQKYGNVDEIIPPYKANNSSKAISEAIRDVYILAFRTAFEKVEGEYVGMIEPVTAISNELSDCINPFKVNRYKNLSDEIQKSLIGGKISDSSLEQITDKYPLDQKIAIMREIAKSYEKKQSEITTAQEYVA